MKQYSEQYDAYFDDRTNEWLESKCDDATCTYCPNRPINPCSHVIYAGQDSNGNWVWGIDENDAKYTSIRPIHYNPKSIKDIEDQYNIKVNVI
jgi:hypothetical protein